MDIGFFDSLRNFVAEMGTTQDKRAHSRITLNNFDNSSETLGEIYRANWVAGKIVDIIPNDMTREWRHYIATEENEPLINELYKLESELKIAEKFNLAHKWARMKGSCFIVINADDGNEIDQPLDLDMIQKGDLLSLNIITRDYISTSGTIDKVH